MQLNYSRNNIKYTRNICLKTKNIVIHKLLQTKAVVKTKLTTQEHNFNSMYVFIQRKSSEFKHSI